jgi:hypothetical protein
MQETREGVELNDLTRVVVYSDHVNSLYEVTHINISNITRNKAEIPLQASEVIGLESKPCLWSYLVTKILCKFTI